MPEESTHDNGRSHEPDAQEKQVATMAVRLPILVVLALLAMLGMGLLAMRMYGG